MFCVGDKIVYPMYGAGVIQAVEPKSIDGRLEEYYVIQMPIGNMVITVSVKKAETLGVRKVSNAEEVEMIMKNAVIKQVKMPDNWNQRYKENMEKIRTGILAEVAEVARCLKLREKERGLSSVEKKMFNSAKQIILSELILSKDIEKETAEELLTHQLFCAM